MNIWIIINNNIGIIYNIIQYNTTHNIYKYIYIWYCVKKKKGRHLCKCRWTQQNKKNLIYWEMENFKYFLYSAEKENLL